MTMGLLKDATETKKVIEKVYPCIRRTKFRITKSRRMYGCWHASGVIYLSRPLLEKNPEILQSTVAHELCHEIHLWLYPLDTEAHGKNFRNIVKKISPLVKISSKYIMY